MDNKKTAIWMRLGCFVELTHEECKSVLSYDGNGDNDEVDKVMKRAISEGRLRIEGDSYIPEPEVTLYNHRFGTNYEEDDVFFELPLIRINVVEENAEENDRSNNKFNMF